MILKNLSEEKLTTLLSKAVNEALAVTPNTASSQQPNVGSLLMPKCINCLFYKERRYGHQILCEITKDDNVTSVVLKTGIKTQRRNPPNPPKAPVFIIDPVPPSDGHQKYIGVKYQRRSHQLPVSDKFFEMARQVKDDANRWILEEHKRKPFPNPPSGLVH